MYLESLSVEQSMSYKELCNRNDPGPPFDARRNKFFFFCLNHRHQAPEGAAFKRFFVFLGEKKEVKPGIHSRATIFGKNPKPIQKVDAIAFPTSKLRVQSPPICTARIRIQRKQPYVCRWYPESCGPSELVQVRIYNENTSTRAAPDELPVVQCCLTECCPVICFGVSPGRSFNSSRCYPVTTARCGGRGGNGFRTTFLFFSFPQEAISV